MAGKADVSRSPAVFLFLNHAISDLGKLFFLGGDYLVDFLGVIVGELLDILLGVLVIVLGDLRKPSVAS